MVLLPNAGRYEPTAAMVAMLGSIGHYGESQKSKPKNDVSTFHFRLFYEHLKSPSKLKFPSTIVVERWVLFFGKRVRKSTIDNNGLLTFDIIT